MERKPRKQIEDMIEELRSWLPNYDRGPNDYPAFLFRILASLPGGDELEDMGYETFPLGWHEVDQLGRMIDAIQDKTDVEDLVHGLVYEEEEDVGEARRRAAHKGEWWIHWRDSEPEGPFEKREDAEKWAAAQRKRGWPTYAIRRGDPEARGQRTREAARPVQVHAALIEALAADVNALRSERRITFEQAYDAITKPDWARQYEADGGDMIDLGNRVINKAKSLARSRTRETPRRRPAAKPRAKKAPVKKTQRRAPRTRRRR